MADVVITNDGSGTCQYCNQNEATRKVNGERNACEECASNVGNGATDSGYEAHLEELEARKTYNWDGHCPHCHHWVDIWVDPEDEEQARCSTCDGYLN